MPFTSPRRNIASLIEVDRLSEEELHLSKEGVTSEMKSISFLCFDLCQLWQVGYERWCEVRVRFPLRAYSLEYRGSPTEEAAPQNRLKGALKLTSAEFNFVRNCVYHVVGYIDTRLDNASY